MGTWELGLPYAAGSIITGGGLIFIAGIADGYARAIDVETGRVLWQDPLAKSSESTPMSYVSPKTGRQYVLVTVPSATQSYMDVDDVDIETVPEEGTEASGTVVAYALPAD